MSTDAIPYGTWAPCSNSTHTSAVATGHSTPPEVLRDQLLKVYGVSTYVTTRLPRPLPAMIRTWIRANQSRPEEARRIARRRGENSKPEQ